MEQPASLIGALNYRTTSRPTSDKASKRSLSRAEPKVRIQFPPAVSPSLSRSGFRGSRTSAFRAAVRLWLGNSVGRDAQGVTRSRQSAAISLSRHIFGPLHCVPLIVRDNFNTADVPTTAGSLSLKGSVPPVDAFQVRKLREAVTVILAKSNMPEFA